MELSVFSTHVDHVYKMKKETPVVLTSKIEPKTENQSKLLESIYRNMYTLVTGPAGCGKTAISAWAAVQYLLSPEHKINKIVFIKPIVRSKFEIDIGALPGDLLQKLLPFGYSLIDNLLLFLDKKHINNMIHNEVIEFVPLTTIRGRSFNNCFCIVDEAQNILSGGIYTVMSRLGQNSKMVINGDMAQSDLDTDNSALIDAINRLSLPSLMKNVGIIEMNKNDIQRNNLIKELMKRFEVI